MSRGSGTIVGAVIILTIIFTTVASYFLAVERDNQRINDSQSIRLARAEERSREDIDIEFVDSDILKANITNRSPLTITLVYYMLLNGSDPIKMGGLDITLASGHSHLLDLGVSRSNYNIKLVSDRGAVFTDSCCDVKSDHSGDGIELSELVHAQFINDVRDSAWIHSYAIEPQTRMAFKLNLTNNSENTLWLSSSTTLLIFTSFTGIGQTQNWYIVKNAEHSIDYLHDEPIPYIRIPPNSKATLYFAASEHDRVGIDPPLFNFNKGSICGTSLLLIGYYGDAREHPYSQMISYKVIVSGEIR